jgi:hypothetical protein
MLRVKLSILFILIISSFSVNAQGYNTALGIRFGGLSNGITLKHFVSNASAVEGILSLGNRTVIITGLYEMHTSIDHSQLFRFYYGVGAHVGFFQDGGYYYYHNNILYTSQSVVGIDGIIGLGYKFKTAPINIGMDLKPFMDFNSGTNLFFDGGVSVRYTF